MQQSDDDSRVLISRIKTYRLGADGYAGGCDADDMANQTPSSSLGGEYCQTLTGESCGSAVSTYIVTDLYDQGPQADQYCYGSMQEDFAKPSEPYTMNWGGCCWVPFTDDTGLQFSGGSYKFIAQVNDVSNNSPSIQIPPLWKLVNGCPTQTLALNPVDADGDSVRCRWATQDEAAGALYVQSKWPSITLDETTCVLTYDGQNDEADSGVKPIAIQVEDYDENGNVKSSMPAQFLAAVWTPAMGDARGSVTSLFPEDIHDDDHDEHVRRRRQASEIPSYCSDAPYWSEATPSAGSEIDIPSSGSLSITVTAVIDSGNVNRMVFNGPTGMVCPKVENAAATVSVTCKFDPTDQQRQQPHTFCFMAESSIGLSSERRCVTLNPPPPAPPVPPATNISEFLASEIENYNDELASYGCAGQGNMDPSAKTHGQVVDELDRQLNQRKQCIKCAMEKFNAEWSSMEYKFNTVAKACGNIIKDY